MKTNFLKLTLLALVLFTASCSNDDNKEAEVVVPAVVTVKATNIPAPQIGGQGQPIAESGAFTKFSFSENKVVTTDKWDIAFRGTSIIVNGGAKIGITDEPERKGQAAVSLVMGSFASVTTIPVASTFIQDGASTFAIPTGSGKGWYDYNMSTKIITPAAGKVFVVKTHDGKYVKFEIISYYKNAPVTPDPLKTEDTRFYTFNFAYQANSTTTF